MARSSKTSAGAAPQDTGATATPAVEPAVQPVAAETPATEEQLTLTPDTQPEAAPETEAAPDGAISGEADTTDVPHGAQTEVPALAEVVEEEPVDYARFDLETFSRFRNLMPFQVGVLKQATGHHDRSLTQWDQDLRRVLGGI